VFRIRQVYDDTTPVNAAAIAHVQAILPTQFPGLGEKDAAKLPAMLRDPIHFRFRSVLLVAEDGSDGLRGFAFLLHAPDLSFSYLEYISAAPGSTGGGIGGALYERVRQEARALGAVGLFFECLPDDEALSPDPEIRKQNAARLRFYERYGAFPIVGTAYETPLQDGDSDPPYLVFDPLGRSDPLSREFARGMVRAILERKYGDVCPAAYVEMVVESFRDDPVRLRPPRYMRPRVGKAPSKAPVQERGIALAVNRGHAIHHIRERGYVEAPVRITSILDEISRTALFEEVEVRHFGDRYLRDVHAPDYLSYLKRACERVPEGKSVYPYVFPIRNAARPPRELPLRAGYYCIDTFTPLNANAYKAARGAVDCALTCAEKILDGHCLAYALVRPPGHHAETRSFGGFCYFNSAAVAVHYLSRYGRVALLDVDYHHGNGAEEIFYARNDVFTVSLHGHPRHTYPYFSGFEDDRGSGAGQGFNLNFAMPEGLDGPGYRAYLSKALTAVRRFRPRYLVLALGLDPAKGDPTGSFSLGAKDFRENGRMIGGLHLPTLVVQEGGYRTRSLGTNARNFFEGLWEAADRPCSPETGKLPGPGTSRGMG
jgi:acetoin utilization deacetylase AcuC-like enzyme/GNAT superfamily N-acetyltransferase